jgi:hypothetical protein
LTASVDDPNAHPAEKLDKVRKKAAAIENEARRAELALSELHPTNMQGIEAADEVNGMLINSIKAKLSLLQDD